MKSIKITTRIARTLALAEIARVFAAPSTTKIRGSRLVAGRRATTDECHTLHRGLLAAFERCGGVNAIVAGGDVRGELRAWCSAF